ncbi:inositol monophosphatase family protein [Thalassobacillus pellis]|uniref:inositol monophosphatase family protein n=1 Tax=Thalassobacillus pellis TaxID=748008 RepID=UPI00195F6816|nr:inositol monophosphatase family protein [Thalassobacillus pellis]MBM7552907.1 myo-inositol-1(or 4)-monophosphatase [Thalassobacillus pellis]
MDKQIRQSLFEQASAWVKEAGGRIRERMNQPFAIDTKSSPNDLVTEIDKDVEKFFAKNIRDKYPEHQLFGEEGFGDDIKTLDGTVWIVDPIDGTMNFVHQKRNFAISVGIYNNGIGEIGIIYDVMGDQLYTAKKGEGAYKNNEQLHPLNKEQTLDKSILAVNAFWALKNRRVAEEGIHRLVEKVRGTRSFGSAALEFAYVAEGILDGYLTMSLMPWDIAAGVVLLEEVGGITTQADGQPVNMLDKTTVLACNKQIHQEIIRDYVELKV